VRRAGATAAVAAAGGRVMCGVEMDERAALWCPALLLPPKNDGRREKRFDESMGLAED
jgi:hypothetical protein